MGQRYDQECHGAYDAIPESGRSALAVAAALIADSAGISAERLADILVEAMPGHPPSPRFQADLWCMMDRTPYDG